jgi:type II secretory pathway component PulK
MLKVKKDERGFVVLLVICLLFVISFMVIEMMQRNFVYLKLMQHIVSKYHLAPYPYNG